MRLRLNTFIEGCEKKALADLSSMLDAKSLMEGLQPLFALKMFLNRFNDQNVRKVLRIVIICVITLQLFKILLIILARRRFTLRKLRQRQLRGVLGHFTAN